MSRTEIREIPVLPKELNKAEFQSFCTVSKNDRDLVLKSHTGELILEVKEPVVVNSPHERVYGYLNEIPGTIITIISTPESPLKITEYGFKSQETGKSKTIQIVNS